MERYGSQEKLENISLYQFTFDSHNDRSCLSPKSNLTASQA